MRRKARAFLPVWISAILAGVVFLKVVRPDDYSPFVRAAMRLEALHVIAHLFLYGTLAAACRLATRAAWAPLALVFAVGFVQEAAQTVLFGRPMGPPEAFDIGVDMTAASLVVLASWLLVRRRRQTLSSATGVLE